jgi:16S rRNA (uracil1498-N3)-methyltransferase
MLNLFFVEELSEGPALLVTGDEAHHAIKVLRMDVGEELLVSDGKGSWVRGEITNRAKSSFEMRILERGNSQFLTPKISVIQALPKHDRAKEAIELLTEAGVDKIIPWTSERSISQWQSDSKDKWRNGAVAASKQSRRFAIPDIGEPFAFHKLPEMMTEGTVLLVLHEAASEKMSEIFAAKQVDHLDHIIVVIGPEGGLTENELQKFEQAGGKVALLGNPIFRSAHAGVAALSAIQALIGRW